MTESIFKTWCVLERDGEIKTWFYGPLISAGTHGQADAICNALAFWERSLSTPTFTQMNNLGRAYQGDRMET